jgi:hypothetical protein
VLTRCALLYDRILAASTLDLEGRAAVQARRDVLYDQGTGVIPVLREHGDALTDRGRFVSPARVGPSGRPFD